MPRFQPKRFEQILADMLARMVARTALSDVSDTSVFKHLLAAAARSDDEQYYQMQNLLSLFNIDTATGDDLDERAKDIQPALISRISAAKATGTVVFSRAGTSGTTTIAIGTKVKTSSGVIFTTTATGTITAASPEQVSGHGVGRDSGLVAVVADLPGITGNAAAGTVTKFETKPAGIDEVTNLSAFANGRDKETDSSFRNRLKLYVQSLARCSPLAMQSALIGQEDPITGTTILFAKVIEDTINLGNVSVYVDDGTGSAESVASSDTSIAADLTWNGTTTITTADTSEVVAGDWIKLNSDGQLFEIDSLVVNTSITILNPGSDTIPSGSGAGASSIAGDIITEGLAGPPAGSAVGGETTLYTDSKPQKPSVSMQLASSDRGNLVENTDYTLNTASGQIDFSPALSAGEIIAASYTYYTGLLAFAQKVIDGDPNDETNYPGLRAAGVLVKALPPQVLLQTVTGSITVAEGFSQVTVAANVTQAIKDYINSLSISDDVIRNEIITRIMEVSGVTDVSLSAPATNAVILDDQLVRVQDANITIT